MPGNDKSITEEELEARLSKTDLESGENLTVAETEVTPVVAAAVFVFNIRRQKGERYRILLCYLKHNLQK